MGFWEKMTGRKPDAMPSAEDAEAEEAEIEAGPSPELAAEAREAQEHLLALEKITEDPDLEQKVSTLPLEVKLSLAESFRAGAILGAAFVTGIVGGAAGKIALEKAMEDPTLEYAMKAGGVALPLLGVSAALFTTVWRRLKERIASQLEGPEKS